MHERANAYHRMDVSHTCGNFGRLRTRVVGEYTIKAMTAKISDARRGALKNGDAQRLGALGALGAPGTRPLRARAPAKPTHFRFLTEMPTISFAPATATNHSHTSTPRGKAGRTNMYKRILAEKTFGKKNSGSIDEFLRTTDQQKLKRQREESKQAIL